MNNPMVRIEPNRLQSIRNQIWLVRTMKLPDFNPTRSYSWNNKGERYFFFFYKKRMKGIKKKNWDRCIDPKAQKSKTLPERWPLQQFHISSSSCYRSHAPELPSLSRRSPLHAPPLSRSPSQQLLSSLHAASLPSHQHQQ